MKFEVKYRLVHKYKEFSQMWWELCHKEYCSSYSLKDENYKLYWTSNKKNSKLFTLDEVNKLMDILKYNLYISDKCKVNKFIFEPKFLIIDE